MYKYKYLPIIKNKDEKGRVLTYTVIFPARNNYDSYKLEFNTLKEARLMATIIE